MGTTSVHGTVKDQDVTIQKLADAVQDKLPYCAVTAGAEAANVRRITVQVKDANGNDLAGRFRVRVWESDAEYGAPAAAGTWALVTGGGYDEESADCAYLYVSDATGKVEVDVTIVGAFTKYFMAEINGVIASSGAVEWTA
ncbi:MAG TPA: hypothetical protein DCX07_14190 [Phycisphaerales bacterium]|nr:hypothetical protein [Phycisphaerales bacterium]